MNAANKQHFEDEVYLVRQKEIKTTRAGKEYLRLELCQNNRRFFGHLWVRVRQWYQALHFGSVLTVTGDFEEVNQQRIIRIKQMAFLAEDIASAKKVVNEAHVHWFESELAKLPAHFSRCVRFVLKEELFYQFFIFPAGKLWAFNYEGGLVKRLQDVFTQIDTLSAKLNAPLIKTAAFLQSVGFLKGMHMGDLYEYKSEARLLSIPLLALKEVTGSLHKCIKDDDERIHLEHLITIMPNRSSEEKDLKPMSLEAICFYRIQQLVADVDAISQLVNREENKKRRWTPFNKQLNRYLYTGNREEDLA